jgi:hypothetical protein
MFGLINTENCETVPRPAVCDATAPPDNSTPPSITGVLREGQTLVANPGEWNNPATFYYDWYRCDVAGAGCLPIVGGNYKTYQLTSGDIGQTVKVVVTATNIQGMATAETQPAGPVEDDPTQVVPATLAGYPDTLAAAQQDPTAVSPPDSGAQYEDQSFPSDVPGEVGGSAIFGDARLAPLVASGAMTPEQASGISIAAGGCKLSTSNKVIHWNSQWAAYFAGTTDCAASQVRMTLSGFANLYSATGQYQTSGRQSHRGCRRRSLVEVCTSKPTVTSIASSTPPSWSCRATRGGSPPRAVARSPATVRS